MAMSVGARRGGQIAAINVTPMIDVLLVLLIIFMVLQEQLRRGLSLQVPPVSTGADSEPDPLALVLEVKHGGGYALNQQPLTAATLGPELTRVLGERNRKVLFVRAEETVSYGDVVAAVDASRAAGATVVGLVPRD